MGLSLVFILIGSLITVLPRSIIFVFFGQRPVLFGYLELISLVLEDSCRLAFAFILTAFSTTLSYTSKSHFDYLIGLK